MKDKEKIEYLKKERDRLKLDVRISEVQWEEEGYFWSGDFRVMNTQANIGYAEEGL